MTTTLRRFFILALGALLRAAAGLQGAHDLVKVSVRSVRPPANGVLIRTFHVGLDAATASWLWLVAIRELPFFPNGRSVFFSDFDLLTALDPRFSFPYSYATLVLPITRYPERIDDAIAIGRRGAAFADPDWRIPFYLAAIYQLERSDFENAVRYYDQAARAP